jgi:hypothetical protein
MIAPVKSSESRAFVPLCAALHWIMTDRGVRTPALDDATAWREATAQLLALIQRDEIQLIGCPPASRRTEKIPGHTLALMRVLAPIPQSITAVFQGDCAHIACCAFMDDEQWLGQFNDELYDVRQSTPTWTHLQVPKDAILKHWPRPEPKSKPGLNCRRWLVEEMRKTPTKRPRPKEAFCDEAKNRFPQLGGRQFNRAWDDAIVESGALAWKKPGPTPKRSDHRTS